MPLNLPKPIEVKTETKTAVKLWVKQLVIRWGPQDSGTAKAELVPITADGEALERDATGTSLMQSVDCPSMVDYMTSGNCPAIATAMAEILKAVEQIEIENERLEAERLEAERLAAEEAEEAEEDE